ncbi:MAG: type I pullulanase [Oscillospiraceae bacterium]|nr:type I pullulanase [Oscillospiraceae bacterium]
MFEDIDKQYAYDGDDLGATYSKEKTTFKVWSPLANGAAVLLYKTCKDEKPYRKMLMEKDKFGVWVKVAHGDLNGVYYTYEIVHEDITEETVDIYAKTCGANGAMGMVIDMSETNPAGWDSYSPAPLRSYTDAVIYELHVRDFSIDPSGNFCYKGRFLAFVEKWLINSGGDKIGIDHLKELGITHVQLMPCFDFQTVDEAAVHKPQFNWGYDPMNFNSPEGSYSTNPFDGKSRVAEFKRLVHALHSAGIGVIMDVVYNHTCTTADSCFTKTFPKYYYRLCGENNEYYSNASGCGNEVATERHMVRKYIIDSLVHWATEYKIDGFRFDLMGIYDIETINMIYDRLHAINPSIILYGEGWTGGGSPFDESKRAVKYNARHVKNVGFFSDDFRDTIKGNNFENQDKGYVNGATGSEEYVKEVMCGRIPHPQISNLTKFAWTFTPSQTVNYVEAHDNLTLWDKIRYTNPTDSLEKRIKMDKMAAAMVFLAQGIPFIQAGQEFLRSKPLPGGAYDHNSYRSPDIVNSIKWDRKSRFRKVFDYYRGLISFRKAHTALRMYDGEEIGRNMRFFDRLPPRIVGFGLYGDCELEEIAVFFNPTEYSVKLHAFGKYNVYIDGENAGNVPLYTVCDDYEIPPQCAFVIGRERNEGSSSADM